MTRVRILTTTGQQPEIVSAVETPDGRTYFVDTLGHRWPSETVVSFRTV